MNYQLHYDKLISTRYKRIREKNIYYEQHHIVPKSMGGLNDEHNLVYLTAREHFIAHWLLWRIYRNKEMAYAFRCMFKFNNHDNKFSSIAYSEMKEAYSKELGNFNRSEKSRARMSKLMIGNKNGAGKRSEEAKLNMSKGQLGLKKSESSKLKNSLSHLGNSNRKGKLASDITKSRISESKKGTSWYNDGVKSFQLDKTSPFISTFVKGRLKTKTKTIISCL